MAEHKKICLLLEGNQKTRSKSVLNVEFFSLLFIFFGTFCLR